MNAPVIQADMQPDAAAARTEPALAPPPGPCILVIFGANGDLTRRLVTPSLYNLAGTGLLPDRFAVIGIDHNTRDDRAWRNQLTEAVTNFVGGGGGSESTPINQDAWGWLVERLYYQIGDFEDPASYAALRDRIAEVDAAHGTGGNVIFYLAVADRFFGRVVDELGKAGLLRSDVADESEVAAPWRRVVIEKPFGHDLASARELNARILRSLDEDQIYRIDHFLGKETVQNIMTFRFSNGMFEPLWNRDHIDHVQITVAETVGVESRGSFYEATGALRDMVPNHVFQLLCMTAMEPPTSFGADAVRSKKVDVFKAIKAVDPCHAVRGQYDAGSVLGRTVRAYRSEPRVDPRSNMETYAALKISIDNWRWAGVPFYIRTGKALTRRMTEIAIRFKQAPMALFDDTACDSTRANWLVMRIQPDEGISLQFEVKRPGPLVDLQTVKMNFAYKDWFPPQQNVGYETLLYDVMVGDQTLFQRADQVEEGWRIVADVLTTWGRNAPDDFPNYIAGTAGPAAADALLARDGGRSWRSVSLDAGPKALPAAPKPA